MKNDFEIEAARLQIEEGNREIESALTRLQTKVEQTAETADHRVLDFVDKTKSKFQEGMERTDHLTDELSEAVNDVLHSAELSANRLAGFVRSFQSVIEKDGEHIIERMERFGQKFRESADEAVGSVDRLFDRGEQIAANIADPVKFLRESPRSVIVTSFLVGIVV
ncbi:MAG: hypothetical protein ACXWPM_09780, partial [Bdellovibrionota bacterium]